MASLIAAPITALGSCFGSCAGACAMTACCKACACKCVAPPKVANLVYVVLMMAGAVLSLTLRYSGVTLAFGASLGINGFSTCFNTTEGGCDSDDSDYSWVPSTSISYDLCSGGKCKGYFAVYQVSFALSTFFSIMTMFTSCKTKAASYVHLGFWYLKLVFVLGMLVATAFMPPDFFAYYAWVARFIAPFFLLYQLTFFINFGYMVNEWGVEADDATPPRKFLCCDNESGMKWKKFMLLATAVMYVIVLVGIGVMYHYYPQDCSFNTGAITVTLLFVLLNTGLSMTRAIAPHGAIITSAIISCYTAWLCASALSSHPSTNCNPTAEQEGTVVSIVSIVIAGSTLAFLAYTAGSRNTKSAAANAAPDQVTVNVPDEDDDGVKATSWFSYHFVMFLCSVYMAMLLTNWGENRDDDEVDDSGEGSISGARYNVGLASAWVQLAANWACNLLYMWTLIAPKCCPGRDFGVEFD